MKEITSTQNALVKQILHLKDKSKDRRKSGLFIVEGIREVELALKGKYVLETLLFNEDIISEDKVLEIIKNEDITLIKISKDVYQKLAYRQTTEGILAIAKIKAHTLDKLQLKNKNPLILIAESPEKPGNIGAILRTADAANLDAVIIANPKGDLYNPNILRSSVGCIFTNNVAIGSTSEIITYLKSNNIAINCAALTASVNYSTVDYKQASAIVVGTEATGLSNEWLEASTQNIIIPMQGEIDSMNVSVAAAIVIFEAKRQRNFN
ncbi:RNA methyltransferase [Joostella atrarenae]|uniref:RNA methyltransferase n=1 Tax=Joostella atrarenae TaxID=679257 RepID=A0ABS9J355_9FLAO|nr:RNA methyltransferase [Joostella atrarenae]MCF8714865.1 RNA methyltransferase [Joostella atrarenae]